MQKQFEIFIKSWKLLKPFHKWFYINLSLAILLSSLSVFLTFISTRIINHVQSKDTDSILKLFLLFLLLGIVWNIIDYFKNKNEIIKLDQDIAQYLQEHSFRKILNLTVEQHIEDHSAIKQQIIARGETSIENIVGKVVTTVIPNISYLTVALVTLFIHSLLLGSLTLLVCTFLFIWIIKFTNFFRPFLRKNRDNWTEQGKTRAEAFTHLQLIKTLSRESYFIKKYLKQREGYSKYDAKINLLNISHKTKRTSFLYFSEQTLFIITIFLTLHSKLTLGGIFLVYSIVGRTFSSITGLSNALREFPLAISEAEKYFEATELSPSFTEDGVKNITLTKDIVVDDVTFAYRKSQEPVLKDVSFTIPHGKTTALVGSSGSGKSTITKLLLRSYEYSDGTITIDETDIKSISAQFLREHIGYVEQHVDLLDDTIKENILLGVKESERDSAEKNLEEIAKHARITEFYHRLGEKKFDTVVGERGIKLSGGERQRVGIARAIIKNPDILIFDEATSSLDTENEAKVMEAIKEVSEGKTTIIIAHRLSTIKDADQIIVMDKGRVVGTGTHEELLASNTYYQNLVMHQV